MKQTACNNGVVAVALLALLSCTADTEHVDSTTTTAPSPAKCPQIGFTPNSDDVATDITASGIDCAEASALVRRARKQHDPVRGPGSFRLPPFACRAVRQDTALESTAYTCDDGPRRVTWSKT